MELRRETRHPLSASGRYRKGVGVRFDIAVQDLSEYGCRFADLIGHLHVGDEVTVTIGQIGPIAARTKWVDRRLVGVEFDHPLHPAVLDHVLSAHDERQIG